MSKQQKIERSLYLLRYRRAIHAGLIEDPTMPDQHPASVADPENFPPELFTHRKGPWPRPGSVEAPKTPGEASVDGKKLKPRWLKRCGVCQRVFKRSSAAFTTSDYGQIKSACLACAEQPDWAPKPSANDLPTFEEIEEANDV